jgi:hypothetical protein
VPADEAAKPTRFTPASQSTQAVAQTKSLGDDPAFAATLERLEKALHSAEKLRDYSALLVSREKIGDQLADRALFVKIRHEPFSVYAYVLAPDSQKGEEAIYVAGKNDGKVLAHSTGLTGWTLGTLSLAPDSQVFMRSQRSPILDIGILNLCRRWVDRARKESKQKACGEYLTKTVAGAKLNGRSCTCIEVVHPRRAERFRFYAGRFFIDDQLGVPLHYEAYDWPARPGTSAELLEEYSYLDVLPNQGFTDADFDAQNPKYGFK